jgi:hypothetical protein
VTEIEVGRNRRILSWLLGLILLTLLIGGAVRASHPSHPAAAHRPKATAADASWDNIPPRLRQYA